MGFKPIPDEEGTETTTLACHHGGMPSFKPIPDEEGTETLRTMQPCAPSIRPASNRSPMRRGLKRGDDCPGATAARASNRSPMRRGLKRRAHHQTKQIRYFRASNRSPMRRGLKRLTESTCRVRNLRFKPIPDEEGTETR